MIEESKNILKELLGEEDMVTDLSKLYQRIYDAFQDQKDRSDQINNNWDIWTCTLNSQQCFQGDSQIFVPAVRDCVEARTKRIMSSVFPPSERYIRAVSESGDSPLATVAMLEHHLKSSKFKELASGLLRYGDVEGQWSIYVDWMKTKRTVTRKKLSHPEIEPDVVNPEETVEDVEQEELIDERPDIWVIPDQDLVVIPATCDHIMNAEWVIVQIRESKAEVKKKIKRGIYDEEAAEPLIEGFESKDNQLKDAEKERANDAGIKVKGKDRQAKIWQAWGDLEIDGEMTPVVIHFGGQNKPIGIHKNPYWCQLPPVISAPPIKIPGSFKGLAKVSTVAPLQYQLNDVMNMGQDSAVFSVQQIVMTDPNKNPRIDSMMLARGAIWQVDPQSTSFAEFPPLYRVAFDNMGALKNQIKESMDVNDSMISQGSKKNVKQQAAEAQEAMSNIMDTARCFENSIMDTLIERLFEYDQQFRDKDISVYELGEMGHEAKIETIPPAQAYKRYYFKWVGTETSYGIQRMQQQIAAMNVLKSVPPTAVPGKKIDISPIIEALVDSAFSPSVGRRVLFDMTKNTIIPPETENELMHNGLPVHIHPEDNDQEHILAHSEGAKLTGDLQGLFRAHIMLHVQAAQAKMQPQQQGGLSGAPGGAGPGMPGQPRPGAQPGTPRPAQNPPGAINQDSMQDPLVNRQ